MLANIANFLVTTLLSAISGTIEGVRGLLNEIVELGKRVGVLGEDFKAFTFGEQLAKDLDRVVTNLNSQLEENQKQVDDLNAPYVNLEIALNDTAKGFRTIGKDSRSVFEQFPNFNKSIKHMAFNVSHTHTEFEKLEMAAKDVNKAMQDASLRGIERLEDSMVSLLQGTLSVKDAFRSMASSVIADLTRIAIQKQITAPLAGMMGGFFTGKAIGGSVQRGQPYMVGERGAEMFVPNQSGSIVPNNQLGGGAVTVNQTINLSAGVSQTVRAEVMNMLPQIEGAAKSAVLDAKRRGGSFAKYV